MELGNKIKALRLRAGLTQEMLADELGVSFQTISKWENSVCAPDITMLPKLSVYFGVTIDELFDLTAEQRLHRIENMLDMEQELPYSTFVETEDFLQEQLEREGSDKARIYSFLAHLYHHRVMSDCEKVEKYARKSLLLRPEVKDVHWLFQKACGAIPCDWNIRNHNKAILIFKEAVAANPLVPRNYLYVMDNLLADHRAKEAGEYLNKYRQLEGHTEFQVLIYEGRIALAEYNIELAEQKFREVEERFGEDSLVIFELANYYADRCDYEKAISYYEKSFAIELAQNKHPIFTDALWGIAMIYEIMGRYEDAVATYDRLMEHLENEFGFTEGEPVRVVQAARLVAFRESGEDYRRVFFAQVSKS